MAHDDAELGGVQPGDDPGPERFEGVAILAAKHGAIGPLPLPLTDIVPDAVAKNVLQGVFPGDVAGLLAHHHRQLALGLDCARALFRHNDVVLWADERMHRAKIRLRPDWVVWG